MLAFVKELALLVSWGTLFIRAPPYSDSITVTWHTVIREESHPYVDRGESPLERRGLSAYQLHP